MKIKGTTRKMLISRRSYDDKREFGDLALLHRLVLYRSLHPPDRSTALSIHIH